MRELARNFLLVGSVALLALIVTYSLQAEDKRVSESDTKTIKTSDDSVEIESTVRQSVGVQSIIPQIR